MLVLKNLDIDLTKSETKTLLGFGVIYSLLVIIIIGSFAYLYYTFQKDLMLQKKRQILQEYSNNQIFRLKDLHINFNKYKFYPRNEKFTSAIYDSEKKEIFSLLNASEVDLQKAIYLNDGYIHFVREPESYYLGTKYLVIEIKDDGFWFEKVSKNILMFSFLAFFLMIFMGYFIAQLFLKPMKDALSLLDRFIKDTTHELNTPVSAIITNIEMIDKSKLDQRVFKKINRIEIGAKTVSNIYEDLTFITLKNKIISQNKTLDLSTLIKQRVEYFKSLALIKRVRFYLQIDEDIKLFADEKKISKLVDNILSNAIKYNKIGGSITVVLKENYLSIEDTGKGIDKKNLNNLFERYSRFDSSVGGFGIGLNIVYLIAKEYNLKINYSSKLNIGTKVEVKWQE